MSREPGVLLSYSFDRHLDCACHAQSCTLRSGTSTAVASSAPYCSAELAAKSLDFVFGLGNALGISKLFRFVEFLAELREPTSVSSFCLGIKQFASIFRPAGA